MSNGDGIVSIFIIVLICLVMYGLVGIIGYLEYPSSFVLGLLSVPFMVSCVWTMMLMLYNLCGIIKDWIKANF